MNSANLSAKPYAMQSANLAPMGITQAHWDTQLRAECEQDFTFFARYFFKQRKGQKFLWQPGLHDVTCDALMRLWRGEWQNMVYNAPPRYSKTELCHILFVAWCYLKNPRCEFIHLSYADQLVMDNSDAIKDVMRSPEYRRLWPTVVITAHRDSKKAWSTTQGGTFYATSAGGSVTGFGAGRKDELKEDGTFVFSGCLLIDDPLKPDDARHDTMREAVNRRWDETIKSRRNSPASTPTLVTMQRIHQKDFTATMLASTDEPWHRVILAALLDEGQPTERALWPRMHTVEMLKAMRDKKNDRGEANPIAGETFSGQYQQNPSPAGGGIVKEAWWRFYADLAEVQKRCTFFFITADTAFKAAQANDPTSLQFWGAEGGKRLYLLDRLHGRWEMPELLENTKLFWTKHPQAKRFYIEDKASGPSLQQMIKKNRTPAQRAESATAILWKPKDYGYPDDKVGRVKKASWQIFQGVVWLPDPTIAPWVYEFVDEHSAFTADDTHAHDDDVDGETMAVSIWTHHGGGKNGQ